MVEVRPLFWRHEIKDRRGGGQRLLPVDDVYTFFTMYPKYDGVESVELSPREGPIVFIIYIYIYTLIHTN